MTAREPWRRISLRVVGAGDDLSWDQAVASPCASCEDAPCCTHLKLHDFEVQSLLHLDFARYLLNFDRMVLGITPDGMWHAYYRYPCRYLDRATTRCTVHATPTQPSVCVHFSPYGCWYRRAYAQAAGPDLVQLDRPRLDWIVARTRFDGNRVITAMPSQDDMRAAFATMPVIEDPDPGIAALEADPMRDAWRAAALAGEDDPPAPAHSFTTLADPCDGCAAYCCTALLFPQGAPTVHAQLDFYRFALGFPGVELSASEQGWAFVIRTRCRHLVDGRCGVFGRDERPLQCRYYDAHKCGYKGPFGTPRPADQVRVRLADFDVFAAQFAFDALGNTIAAPSTAQLRAAIEASWRAAAAPSR